MGDLSSTNFGCSCGRNERSSCGCNNGCGNNSCLWIILILLFCGGNTFGRSGSGCGCNDGCDNSCIWIILILLFCGGNTFGLNNGCGCGCGCNDGCC